jgi:peptidylprolyl isomerase
MILAAVPAPAAEPAADPVVAGMGSVVLRTSDLRRLLDAQPPEVRRQVSATPDALDRLTRTEVFRRVLLDEARAKAWDKRPDVVAQLERAREQLLVSTYIGNLAQPPADYPGEAEVEALYKARMAELSVPPQKRLAQIFLDAGATDNGPEIRRKAEALSRQAREKNADFAALARANSQHQASAGQGGDMGWLADAEMIPELRGVIVGLAAGQVSDPIRGASGWHVVKVIEARPAAVRPLAAVRDVLVAALRKTRARENEQRHLDRLAEKTPLSINQAALEKLLDTAPGTARQ